MKTIISIALFILTAISLYAQRAPELFPFHERSGFVGYCLADRTPIIKPQFLSATGFTEGYYIVSKAEYETTVSGQRGNSIPGTEKYALLDSMGHYVIDFDNEYDYLGVENGFIIVYKADMMGIVSDKNKFLIPAIYGHLNPINNSLIVAKKDDKTGIINIQNNIVIPHIYDKIHSVTKVSNNYYAIVNTGENYGIIDQQGKFIIAMNPIKFCELTPTSIAFEEKGLYGLCDFNLKTILPAIYGEPFIEDDGISFSKGDTKYYFTNDGKLIRKKKFLFMEKIPN